mmetsp:Transcript_4627/g.8182  ORF Transcript_4627/g.8182 Transcript_4627/m.8182 type:complete len:265 (+) Transcript_4627:87-881(+)
MPPIHMTVGPCESHRYSDMYMQLLRVQLLLHGLSLDGLGLYFRLFCLSATTNVALVERSAGYAHVFVKTAARPCNTSDGSANIRDGHHKVNDGSCTKPFSIQCCGRQSCWTIHCANGDHACCNARRCDDPSNIDSTLRPALLPLLTEILCGAIDRTHGHQSSELRQSSCGLAQVKGTCRPLPVLVVIRSLCICLQVIQILLDVRRVTDEATIWHDFLQGLFALGLDVLVVLHRLCDVSKSHLLLNGGDFVVRVPHFTFHQRVCW